jgi:predicted transcriptional regulator
MVQTSKEHYEKLGFSTIPLLTDGKQTDLKAWSTRPSADLWHEADQYSDRYGNIGIRSGAGVAVLDADDETTATAIHQHFDGLGFGLGQYPSVRTWSGGRHFYFDLAGNYMRLGNGLSGELRYGAGAYCVAPHSVVNGSGYNLISGDWSQLPRLTWSDVEALVPLKENTTASTETRPPTRPSGAAVLPVPLMRRDLPPYVWHRLNWLNTAQRGDGFEKYKSRSELEFSVLQTIARSGRGQSEAVALFEKKQPAHYAESKSKYWYLSRSWAKAIHEIAIKEPRPAIANLHNAVNSRSWTSTQYDTDRRVLLGIVSLAYEAATWGPATSQRDLMLLSGVKTRVTVRRSLERLEEAGIVCRVKGSRNTRAAVYDISQFYSFIPVLQPTIKLDGQDYTIRHSGDGDSILSYGIGLSSDDDASTRADSFTGHQGQVKLAVSRSMPVEVESALWSLLGGSCRPVYEALSDDDIRSVAEIAEMVNRSQRTVTRALDKLQRYGLVKCGLSGWWFITETSIETVAERLKLADDVEERRQHIGADRKRYRNVLKYWAERAGDNGATDDE